MTAWDRMPQEVRAAVAERTGAIEAVEPAPGGPSSQLAATLHTVTGPVFVKGLRSDHPWAWTQAREEAAAAPVAPRVLWRIVTHGWDVLGFEHVEGEPADLRPGAKDLPAVVAAMTQLAGITAPERVLADAAERWGDQRFAGSSLLHTHWQSTNAIVTAGGVRLVDWAWATRGAPWIDPACWVVWLINARHRPADAETWAGRVPAYGDATPEDLDLFATALAREWQRAADESPSRLTARLRDAAAAWDAHRRISPQRR